MNKTINVASNDGQRAWLRIEGFDDLYFVDREDTPGLSVADFLEIYPPGKEILVTNFEERSGQAVENGGGVA